MKAYAAVAKALINEF